MHNPRWLSTLAVMGALLPSLAHAADPPALPAGDVGMQVAIDGLVLPGTELEPVPVSDEIPVIIRIDDVAPHGTDLRYDLVCSGLEPGRFDLREFLRRKDGSTTDDLPELVFQVNSLLPAGQIEPHGLEASRLPWLGGYRSLMIMGALLWSALLIWLVWPRKPKPVVEMHADKPPESLADRLRPLVTDAMSGQLPPAKLAELERALVQYWKRRLQIDEPSPARSIARLRVHPDAGPLIGQLETWLHRPAGNEQVDINELLEPYRDVSASDLTAPADEEHPSPSTALVGDAT